ncbi:Flavonol synthase/flavanone 3-hydroxylase [Arachis hypogaea]|nr:Flavonol synthase/flavanone 3-hydroxylase [Arachis hypogaea]
MLHGILQPQLVSVPPTCSLKPESEKLRSALTSAGCFQAIGHGMSTSYLHKIRQVSKQFFQLPVEEKQKYARAANDSEGEILEEFSIKVKSMMDYLLRCMGRSLNPEEGSFLDQFGGQSLFAASFSFIHVVQDPIWYSSLIQIDQ